MGVPDAPTTPQKRPANETHDASSSKSPRVESPLERGQTTAAKPTAPTKFSIGDVVALVARPPRGWSCPELGVVTEVVDGYMLGIKWRHIEDSTPSLLRTPGFDFKKHGLLRIGHVVKEADGVGMQLRDFDENEALASEGVQARMASARKEAAKATADAADAADANDADADSTAAATAAADAAAANVVAMVGKEAAEELVKLLVHECKLLNLRECGAAEGTGERPKRRRRDALPAAHQGDRVRVDDPLQPRLHGKMGTVVSVSDDTVQVKGERGVRAFSRANLVIVKAAAVVNDAGSSSGGGSGGVGGGGAAGRRLGGAAGALIEARCVVKGATVKLQLAVQRPLTNGKAVASAVERPDAASLSAPPPAECGAERGGRTGGGRDSIAVGEHVRVNDPGQDHHGMEAKVVKAASGWLTVVGDSGDEVKCRAAQLVSLSREETARVRKGVDGRARRKQPSRTSWKPHVVDSGSSDEGEAAAGGEVGGGARGGAEEEEGSGRATQTAARH